MFMHGFMLHLPQFVVPKDLSVKLFSETSIRNVSSAGQDLRFSRKWKIRINFSGLQVTITVILVGVSRCVRAKYTPPCV